MIRSVDLLIKTKGTTDAIFIVRHMQTFRATGKKCYFCCIGLEIAFDRVPREVIRWAMHMLGVEECFV